MEDLKTGMPAISSLLHIKARTSKANQSNAVAQSIYLAASKGQSCCRWEGPLQKEVRDTLQTEGYVLKDVTWNNYPTWIISWD